MKDRIRKIRKDANMTQEKFASVLGVKRNTIATYEIGKSEPMDSVIVSICREFNVNREWLLTGEGNPYTHSDAALATYVSEITDGDDDFIKDLIVAYMELDEASKEAIRVLAEKMADKRNKREQT